MACLPEVGSYVLPQDLRVRCPAINHPTCDYVRTDHMCVRRPIDPVPAAVGTRSGDCALLGTGKAGVPVARGGSASLRDCTATGSAGSGVAVDDGGDVSLGPGTGRRHPGARRAHLSRRQGLAHRLRPHPRHRCRDMPGRDRPRVRHRLHGPHQPGRRTAVHPARPRPDRGPAGKLRQQPAGRPTDAGAGRRSPSRPGRAHTPPGRDRPPHGNCTTEEPLALVGEQARAAGYVCAPSAREALRHHLDALPRSRTSGNARPARRIVEQTMTRRSGRLGA
ncbi:hypothetical protein [Streptomyces sp. NPDC014676]|uniref:hypothetical protein n=1 Tax=Streptomyces sp. NPDC014676 TaxID=3364879 RepID=UPI0036FD49D2